MNSKIFIAFFCLLALTVAQEKKSESLKTENTFGFGYSLGGYGGLGYGYGGYYPGSYGFGYGGYYPRSYYGSFGYPGYGFGYYG